MKKRLVEIKLRSGDHSRIPAEKRMAAIKASFETAEDFSSTHCECKFVVECESLGEVEEKLFQLEKTGMFFCHVISFHGNRNGAI